MFGLPSQRDAMMTARQIVGAAKRVRRPWRPGGTR